MSKTAVFIGVLFTLTLTGIISFVFYNNLEGHYKDGFLLIITEPGFLEKNEKVAQSVSLLEDNFKPEQYAVVRSKADLSRNLKAVGLIRSKWLFDLIVSDSPGRWRRFFHLDHTTFSRR